MIQLTIQCVVEEDILFLAKPKLPNVLHQDHSPETNANTIGSNTTSSMLS